MKNKIKGRKGWKFWVGIYCVSAFVGVIITQGFSSGISPENIGKLLVGVIGVLLLFLSNKEKRKK